MSVRLNIVPFQEKDTFEKKPATGQPVFKVNWRQFQKIYYNGDIADNQNVLCITGALPDGSAQLVVIDFDKDESDDLDYKIIHNILLENQIRPYKIVRSGSGGLHFYILVELKNPLFTCERRTYWNPALNLKGLKEIDVRAEGGVIYYPGTKFIDSNEYTPILEDKSYINKYEYVLSFLNNLFMVNTQAELKKPFKYNKMRKAFRDMIDGQYVIPHGDTTVTINDEQYTCQEFQYWLMLFREFVTCVDEDYMILINWFRDNKELQPEFDYNTCVIQCKQNYTNENWHKRPTNDMYSKYFRDYDVVGYGDTWWNDEMLSKDDYYYKWLQFERDFNGQLYEDYDKYYGKITKELSVKYGLATRSEILSREAYAVIYYEYRRKEYHGCVPIVFASCESTWYSCNTNGIWRRMKDDAEIRKQLITIYRRSFKTEPTSNTVNEMIKIFCNRNTIQIRFDEESSSTLFEYDRYFDKIVFKNGILYLKPDFTIDHFDSYIDPRLYLSYTLGVDYKPTASSEMFETFITTMFKQNNELIMKESIKTVCCFLSDCLIPGNKLEWMLMLLGKGRNGKGVIATIMQKILNNRTTSLDENDYNYTFGMQSLQYSLLNIISEVGEDLKKSVKNLKRISGEDKIEVQVKNKNSINMQIMAKNLILANQTPKFAEQGDAIWKRLMCIICPNQFTGVNEDNTLKERFLEDDNIAGVINHLIKYLPLRKQCKIDYWINFNNYEIYRSYNENILNDFFSDVLTPSDNKEDKITINGLLAIYKAWYFATKYEEASMFTDESTFGKRLSYYLMNDVNRNFYKHVQHRKMMDMRNDKNNSKSVSGYIGVHINPIQMCSIRTQIATYVYKNRLNETLHEGLMYIPYDIRLKADSFKITDSSYADLYNLLPKEHPLEEIWSRRRSYDDIDNSNIVIKETKDDNSFKETLNIAYKESSIKDGISALIEDKIPDTIDDEIRSEYVNKLVERIQDLIEVNIDKFIDDINEDFKGFIDNSDINFFKQKVFEAFELLDKPSLDSKIIATVVPGTNLIKLRELVRRGYLIEYDNESFSKKE